MVRPKSLLGWEKEFLCFPINVATSAVSSVNDMSQILNVLTMILALNCSYLKTESLFLDRNLVAASKSLKLPRSITKKKKVNRTGKKTKLC